MAPPASSRRRLRVEVVRARAFVDELAADVRRGLTAPVKSLLPKYFYDDAGSRLFDAICDLPEYYPTRTEQSLLEDVADEIVRIAQPQEILEFGSGTSRKTRLLLDAVGRAGLPLRYMPFDVSDGALRHAARALLREYPRLAIHALVGDYERDLGAVPNRRQRLVVFLGSTIGNFNPVSTLRFLRNIRRQLVSGDHLLLGVDLLKPVAVIEAAYNDSAGVTADFNLNVLRVINRHLDADFVPDQFAHLAFFNPAYSQIEMHLQARTALTVHIRRLDLTIRFAAGETIHTEISRKFTRAEVEVVLRDAGFALSHWYTPANNYFGLALARAGRESRRHGRAS